MRIVISGVGETGFYLAEILLKEGHDLVLIEKNEKAYHYAKERLDAQIIHEDGANSLALEPVIDEKTDFFIALTDNDEVNILSTLIAKRYGAKRALTRVSEPSNLIHPLLTEEPGVSVLNSEIAIAKDLVRLVGNPSADEIEFFANGKAEMVKFHVGEQSEIIYKKLSEIKIPSSWLFIALIKKGEFQIASGDSVLESGDQVLMMGDPAKSKEIESLLDLHPVKVKRVIMVGFNEISESLTKSLKKKDIEVRLIEEDKQKAEQASAELDNALVFQGDGTGEDILEQAGIGQTDILLALTEDDETNILISLLAKEKKVRRVVALAQKPQYNPIIEKIGIDSVVNPRSAMVDEVIRAIHHKNISNINILEGGKGQMMEFIIKNKTKIVDIPLAKIKLPKQTLIGAIVRNEGLIIPRGDDKIQLGDHILVFARRMDLRQLKHLFVGQE